MIWLGVDVGSRGARAGLFGPDGDLLSVGKAVFELLQGTGGIAEYRSGDIWQATCTAVSDAMAAAGIHPDDVSGVGVDAACSLVLDLPLGESINPNGEPGRDCIAWMDHRAAAETDRINRTGAAVLANVGGRISPEMQIPKLLWLSRHRPRAFAAAGGFYDLADWLTWRMTGAKVRSLCTAVCKWTYSPDRGGWDDIFLRRIGLGALDADGHARIGTAMTTPGDRIGVLRADAATELGLAAGTPVGAGLIDAYAGALGTLAAGGESARRMALIAGTSACHIVLTDRAIAVPGVWGPYPGVIGSGSWALEAGQSACGAFLDTLVARHPAHLGLVSEAERRGIGLFTLLDEVVEDATARTPAWTLAARRHVLPDILGNRAPLADPARRGAITGFGIEGDAQDLAVEYLAALQALACGTRHILDEMNSCGVNVSEIIVSGGLSLNRSFLQMTADVTGCSVLVPVATEPVLLGSAMLGAAAGTGAPLAAAVRAMSGQVAKTVDPDLTQSDTAAGKYRVFRQMLDDQIRYDAIMEGHR